MQRYIIEVESDGDMVWFGEEVGAMYESRAQAQMMANTLVAATNRVAIVTEVTVGDKEPEQ